MPGTKKIIQPSWFECTSTWWHSIIL